MASDGPSPHSPSLRLGLTGPQPSRRYHTQSLLGPSFHDPRPPHVFECHPERAAPLSRRDDERRHAVGSHSAFTLCLYLAACNPSSCCRSGVLDHLCSQSFHSCWIMETWSLNHCVFLPLSSTFAFLIEIDSSFKSLFAIWWLSPQWFHYYFYCNIISWQYQKYWTVKEGKKKMFDLRQNATNRATRRFSIGKVRVNTWLILEFWIFESTVARWPCILNINGNSTCVFYARKVSTLCGTLLNRRACVCSIIMNGAPPFGSVRRHMARCPPSRALSDFWLGIPFWQCTFERMLLTIGLVADHRPAHWVDVKDIDNTCTEETIKSESIIIKIVVCRQQSKVVS